MCSSDLKTSRLSSGSPAHRRLLIRLLDEALDERGIPRAVDAAFKPSCHAVEVFAMVTPILVGCDPSEPPVQGASVWPDPGDVGGVREVAIQRAGVVDHDGAGVPGAPWEQLGHGSRA